MSFDLDEKSLVAELVEGAPLRGMTPDPRRVTELGAELAEGLAAAHRAGSVQNNCKPDTKSLTRGGSPKIPDLGLAAHTHRGAVAGTPANMAPEQARGRA